MATPLEIYQNAYNARMAGTLNAGDFAQARAAYLALPMPSSAPVQVENTFWNASLLNNAAGGILPLGILAYFLLR